MSQHGNYYDNLRAEFMRNRFKAEVLDSGHFFGLSEAKFETMYYRY
jgi:hypothetical protein